MHEADQNLLNSYDKKNARISESQAYSLKGTYEGGQFLQEFQIIINVNNFQSNFQGFR